MTKLQCLIVEDEPLAAEVLTDYINQVPFLSLVAWCTDAVTALEYLRGRSIDAIFLDLHLPGIKGFDLLKTLPRRPQVIITTAYHQYALQGYEWQVVDYLVKPVEFSRFLSAVNKLSVGEGHRIPGQEREESSEKLYWFFNTDKKRVKVFIADILYAESQKDYVKIVSRNKTIVVRQTLQELERLLPAHLFIRIHRSYLVAKEPIEAFDASHVEIAGQKIPIGRVYKDHVFMKLKK